MLYSTPKYFLYRHGFFNAKSVFAGPVLRTESDSVFIAEQGSCCIAI